MKNSKRILHLTLKQPWFDMITEGMKSCEYRDIKPYWTKRFEGKTFDEVHFRNGYTPDRPFMRVECLNIFKASGKYCIALGKILEVRR